VQWDLEPFARQRGVPEEYLSIFVGADAPFLLAEKTESRRKAYALITGSSAETSLLFYEVGVSNTLAGRYPYFLLLRVWKFIVVCPLIENRAW
jgi:hypothetical protein